MTFIIGWLIALQLQSIDFHTNCLLWIIPSLLWFNFKYRIATSLPTSTRNTHLIHQEPAIRGKKQWKYYNERKNKKKKQKLEWRRRCYIHPLPPSCPPFFRPLIGFAAAAFLLRIKPRLLGKFMTFPRGGGKGWRRMEEDGGGGTGAS